MVEHMHRQHVVANSDINMDRADGNAEVAKDAETNKQMLVSGSDLKTLINCVLRNLLICCFFDALLSTNWMFFLIRVCIYQSLQNCKKQNKEEVKISPTRILPEK